MSIPNQTARVAWSVRLVAPVSLALLSPARALDADSPELEKVTVSASRLREQDPLDVPASVTVLSESALHDGAQQHFQEVLSQVPNLNWAAGSSRPRYFQIRGIGEREQYEGAPNPSVGFLIDDIDFSGVGMAATLFDVSQVEVLRGPQGTRLGANALAGLIAVQSAAPSDHFDLKATADLGNYDTGSLGVAATAPVESLNSAWRLAVQKYRSDGFRTNSFLHREDTNGRDELTARGKWRTEMGESGRLDLTFMHANLDNGYDAFSIDNSRTTLSDQPGEDSQRVNAMAIKWHNTLASQSSLTLIATVLDSSSVHAYDADWGNPQSWAPYDYSYVYRSERMHDTQSAEIRFASAPLNADTRLAWLVGAYALRVREGINETTNYSDPLQSHYEAVNAAVFAQLDGRLADRWVWAAGVRGEQRDADYDDTRPSDATRKDRMMGGQVSLTFEATDSARLYGSIARGYKAGGFNLGSAAAVRQEFEPEFVWNYELGMKIELPQHSLYLETSLFYMQRQHMQVRSGEQVDPTDPTTYIFVTSNVASGRNYGLEATLRWLPTAHLELGASVGLLRTRETGSLTSDGDYVAPRAQAHSPEYQVQINATYRRRGWMARVDTSAVDAFYFDVPADHDQRSTSYALTNIKAGFETDTWQVHAWLRNAFDEQYATRGFFFANEPPDFPDKLYIQNGDPRQFGVTLQWSLR